MFLLPPLVALIFGFILFTVVTNTNIKATPQQTGNTPLAPLFTPEVQYWANDIVRWSSEHNIDPNITATIMQIESCGNPYARSSAGAAGLFQVMPFHFASGENSLDPDTNAMRGLDYLAKALKYSGGDTRLAFAGYNGGIGVIDKSELGWAAETIRYVYWGTGIYADASQNSSSSSRLDEWLAAGGTSLCTNARQRLGILPGQ